MQRMRRRCRAARSRSGRQQRQRCSGRTPPGCPAAPGAKLDGLRAVCVQFHPNVFGMWTLKASARCTRLACKHLARCLGCTIQRLAAEQPCHKSRRLCQTLLSAAHPTCSRIAHSSTACRSGEVQYTARRLALRHATAQRSARRGQHDSTGASVVKRFVNVPRLASHDPHRDSFESAAFSVTDEWRS